MYVAMCMCVCVARVFIISQSTNVYEVSVSLCKFLSPAHLKVPELMNYTACDGVYAPVSRRENPLVAGPRSP